MSAPRAEIETALLDFFREHFLVEIGTDFESDTNLFAAHIIDSFGFIELVRFIESRFNVTLQESDLTGGELTSIDGMTGLIEKRTHERIHA